MFHRNMIKKNQNYVRTYSCSNFTKFPSSDGREPEKLFVPKLLQIQQVNSIMLTPIGNILKIIFLEVHIISKKYMNKILLLDKATPCSDMVAPSQSTCEIERKNKKWGACKRVGKTSIFLRRKLYGVEQGNLD